jgi:hypothetical protein
MPVTVQGPDGNTYQFPDGTDKDAAVRYFRSKGIGGTAQEFGSLRAATPTPSPKGVLPWLQNAEEDITHGGRKTIVGKTLGYLQGQGEKGYSGLESGVSPETAQYMGSVPIGSIKMLKGIAETPSHPIMGPLHAIGGALQAASIPSAFMAGPGAEAAIEAIPSRAHAGRLFESVMSDAANQPVSLTKSLPALERAQQLSERGHGTIGALDSLYKRINQVNPLDYAEARDRASAISGLTGQDKINATKMLQREAKNFSHAFNEDIGSAAEQVGRGSDYLNAMKEYSQASKLRDVGIGAAKYGIPAVLGSGILAGIAKKLIP